MSQARSRSPRRDLEIASPGLLRMLDAERMQLRLDGERASKILYFGDNDIWLEAKPLVLYLEYSPNNVTHTLGLVKDKNKKSLKELLEANGSPKWVDWSHQSTPGYHDLKALYVNEPGLYSLIFKSTKPQAQDFQDWVYEEVLTALRRRGSYSVGERKELLSDVLVKRVDRSSSRCILAVRKSNRKQHRALARVKTAFEDRVALLETTFRTALHAALSQQEERMLSKLARQCEQVSVRAIMYGQKIFRSALLELMEPALSPLRSLTHNVSMKVRGAVKDVIDAAVTSPDSLLVRSFRSATRGPARRKTLDPLQFPEEQRASDLEQALESLSLAQVAHALCPAMKYPAWKAVRGGFGKACLAERKRRGRYPSDHPLHIPKPLLWSFVGPSTNQGGGARRVYLQSQRGLVEGVWKKLDKDGSSFHSKAEKESLERPDEPWPVNAAELEPPDFSAL
jgi:prophage antirepressor-like protein